MATVRARLTTAYAIALGGTVVALAIVLLIARRASAYRDLGEQVQARANEALAVVREAEEQGLPITSGGDTLAGSVVAPQLRRTLESFPDYVLVLDPSGRALYLSFEATSLGFDDVATLQRAALKLAADGVPRVVRVGRRRLLLSARMDPRADQVGRIAAATDVDVADRQVRSLAATLVGILPIFLLLSLLLAYVISGRAFQPVERIINEVEAITDGRSLHRRLPTESGNDEIGRLTNTLNAMIARLETSFGALRRFTADASHELKTPLTVLRADVERAMNPKSSHNEQLVALEEALQETSRMADLVDSLLTLARADEGRFELVAEPIRLEPLTREVFETAVILGEDAGLEVSLPVIEDAVVLGDRTRLRQLFLNLVTNAIKYTPRGGRVEVALARRTSEVTFTVRDTGIGIAAADLPYVFERFWRADRARSRVAAERGGWGLGLSISQYIAQAHGGRLELQSRLGRGSTFTVTLPVPTDEQVLGNGRPGDPGA